MKQLQHYLAVLCVALLAAPPGFGQDQERDPRGPQVETHRAHWYSGIKQPYEPRNVPPVNV